MKCRHRRRDPAGAEEALLLDPWFVKTYVKRPLSATYLDGWFWPIAAVPYVAESGFWKNQALAAKGSLRA
jgi:hypothetical protein